MAKVMKQQEKELSERSEHSSLLEVIESVAISKVTNKPACLNSEGNCTPGGCINCIKQEELSVEKETKVEVKSKRLVICCAGNESLHEHYTNTDLFDTLIIYYGDSEEIASRYRKNATYFAKQKGIKFNLVWSVVNSGVSGLTEEQLLKYDYIALLDDDILTNTIDIDNMFNTMDRESLDLAQASLSNDSHIFWRILKTKEKGIRLFNTVEIMMPFFNRETFAKQYFLWEHLYTGILLDTKFWVKMVQNNNLKCAVVDDIQMKHTRRFAKGDVYKNNSKRQGSMLPRTELITAFRILGINRLEYDSVRKEEIRELTKKELIAKGL